MISFKQYRFILFALLLTFVCSNAQSNEKWKIFQLENLNFKKDSIFLNTATISGYVETTGENYTLQASKYDRVFFVVEGKGEATIEEESIHLKSTDILFVKATHTLTFVDELRLLSFVSKSTKTNHNFKTQVFSEDFITNERDASQNIWNQFIENTTMAFGLYMLPKLLDGDATLTHEVDEINLVLNGTAKFKMNDTIVDVKPGTIMWVKSGVGHYFYDLSADFDVYILFEQTN